METIDGILNEVDKLPPSERLMLLHQLVDRMLAGDNPKSTNQTDFGKYMGIGKDVWKADAQTFINDRRNEERF